MLCVHQMLYDKYIQHMLRTPDSPGEMECLRVTGHTCYKPCINIYIYIYIHTYTVYRYFLYPIIEWGFLNREILRTADSPGEMKLNKLIHIKFLSLIGIILVTHSTCYYNTYMQHQAWVTIHITYRLRTHDSPGEMKCLIIRWSSDKVSIRSIIHCSVYYICMYIYIYTHICVYTYVCIYTYTYIYTSLSLSISLSLSLSLYIYVYIHVLAYTCMY